LGQCKKQCAAPSKLLCSYGGGHRGRCCRYAGLRFCNRFGFCCGLNNRFFSGRFGFNHNGLTRWFEFLCQIAQCFRERIGTFGEGEEIFLCQFACADRAFFGFSDEGRLCERENFFSLNQCCCNVGIIVLAMSVEVKLEVRLEVKFWAIVILFSGRLVLQCAGFPAGFEC
jgi:hypothetical protein